jgi:hypothetical protein
MTNVFDYVNEILRGKTNLIIDEETEKGYVPFLVNRALSYHYDTVLYANEMNRRHHIDKKLQNDFFINTVRSKKRSIVKWAKTNKDENMQYVKKAYGLSDAKALDALRLLSQEQIQKLKEHTDTGGLRN